jgi:hypothetical protein
MNIIKNHKSYLLCVLLYLHFNTNSTGGFTQIFLCFFLICSFSSGYFFSPLFFNLWRDNWYQSQHSLPNPTLPPVIRDLCGYEDANPYNPCFDLFLRGLQPSLRPLSKKPGCKASLCVKSLMFLVIRIARW